MASWDDVRAVALALPETVEPAARQWRVRSKAFAFERPLRRADLAHLGAAAPTGPILGDHTADEGVKRALVASAPGVFFTTPYFDGYATVLVRLEEVALDELWELITDAWLARAPARLAASYLAGRPQG